MSTLPLSGLHHQPALPGSALPRPRPDGMPDLRRQRHRLANLHSHDFPINTAWLTLVLIAADLLACLNALPFRVNWPAPTPNGCVIPCCSSPGGVGAHGAAHYAAAGRRLAMGHRVAHRVLSRLPV
jgi:hypothetical protein